MSEHGDQVPYIRRPIGGSSDEPIGGPIHGPRGEQTHGPTGPSSQLEPEHSYILAYEKADATRHTLATIAVGKLGVEEVWTIDAQAVSTLRENKALYLNHRPPSAIP